MFFFGYSGHSRTCITFDIFISDISDIQQLIYWCTFSWCSKSSAFFQDIYQGHVLHLTYLFWIFRKFSSSCICAHSADAPEVLHFFQDIYLRTRAVLFRYSRHPRTCITFDIFISDILTPGTFITFGIFISRNAGFVHTISLMSWSNLLVVYNCPPRKSLLGVQLTG